MELNSSFDLLCKEVRNCTFCERMHSSRRVLNRSVGALSADLIFIGEAPGRLGADDSGIPFHGDKSGHNFEELIQSAGISRAEIYITNAVLCNPKDEHGNNATPSSQELTNCSNYLKRQIEIVNPKIVVTLGANALFAARLLFPHGLVLKDDVRTANRWFDRILIPLYHPGQRAMMSRSMANQRSDYRFVADQLKSLGLRKKSASGKTALSTSVIVDYLFSKQSAFTYFALHKLFYLIEYNSVKTWGYRLTNAYIIRQKDGPYCTDLNLFKLQKAMPYLQTKNLSKSNVLVYYQSNLLFQERLIDQHIISDTVRDFLDKMLAQYGHLSNAALKKTVYFTQPMRNILNLEQQTNLGLYNQPIDFSPSPNY